MLTSTPLVLVADDEPSMLELVARHLRTMNAPKLEVIQASDGEEAWRLAREHLPDLVVLDVMMPGMSGWEVCRKIREDVALAHTGVVMLTGIGENLNQMTSPLYGADAYIDKPFDFDELDRKVEQALNARASLRGDISRPAVNGVAGPAKVARGGALHASPRPATKAKKPAAKPKVHASPKKAAKKRVMKKAVATRPAPKKATAKRPVVKAKTKPKLAAKKAGRPQPKGKTSLKAKKPAPKKKATRRR